MSFARRIRQSLPSDSDGNSRCATSLLHSDNLSRTPPLHTTSSTPVRSVSSPYLEGNSRGRTMVLPHRRRLGRHRRAAQADPMPTLQHRRHTQSPRRSLRIRRQQPSTNHHPSTTHLLQQPGSAARVRANLQRLARRQDPTPEHYHAHPVDLSPTRRRRHHRRGHQSHQVPAKQPNLATHLEAIRPRTIRHAHRAPGSRSAARVAGRARTSARRCTSPRSSPDQLPQHRLSHRRLPTGDPILLRLNRPS